MIYDQGKKNECYQAFTDGNCGPSTLKSLQTTLGAMFEAASTHKSVTAVHEKQEDFPHMTCSHHLSRAACWLRGKDRLATCGQ